MRGSPVISVIIPVYNGRAYLAEAILSALAQTCPPGEIIVVDDGSTDESAAIAQRFGLPVTCVQIPHTGAAAARNQGVAQARGDYLAFLDADDLWLPDKLARQIPILEENPRVEVVLGMVDCFISPELALCQRQNLVVPDHVQSGYLVGALIRKASFERIGGFNPGLRSGELVDWWARASDLGLNSVVLPGVVVRRRVHGQNHTLQRRETLQDFVGVARAALERRRKSAV